MRQTIALQARIAAGDIGPATPRRPNRIAADPRLSAVRRILHTAADGETDPAARRAVQREIDERLEDLCETDPGGGRSADEIIDAICDDLGIRVDPSTLPDELLALALSDEPRSAAGSSTAGWSATGWPDAGHERPSPPRPSGPDPP